MKTIIVPTDFTAASNNAVQFAVDMAMQINATIFLLHVYQLPVAITEPPAMALTMDEIRKASEERLTQLKEEIIKQVNYKINVIADARPGSIIDELVIACKKMRPFAVVMGNCRSGKTAAYIVWKRSAFCHSSFGNTGVDDTAACKI